MSDVAGPPAEAPAPAESVPPPPPPPEEGSVAAAFAETKLRWAPTLAKLPPGAQLLSLGLLGDLFGEEAQADEPSPRPKAAPGSTEPTTPTTMSDLPECPAGNPPDAAERPGAEPNPEDAEPAPDAADEDPEGEETVEMSKAMKGLFQAQFHKTQMCRYVGTRCLRGSGCPFAHSPTELRYPPDLKKTSICKMWEKGRCRASAEDCAFAHGATDLRTTAWFRKAALCAQFAGGRCAAGASCPDSHRLPQQPVDLSQPPRPPPRAAAAAAPALPIFADPSAEAYGLLEAQQALWAQYIRDSWVLFQEHHQQQAQFYGAWDMRAGMAGAGRARHRRRG